MHWQVHKIQFWQALKYLRAWISHSSEILCCRENLESSVGQDEFEPALLQRRATASQRCPQEEHFHPVKECDSSTTLSSEETHSGLHIKERHELTRRWRSLRDRSIWHMKKGWERWDCSAWRREGSRGIFTLSDRWQ